MFDDLIPGQSKSAMSFDDLIPAPKPSAGATPGWDSANAFTGNMIEQVPIVGPYIREGADRAGAGIRALMNDTKYSDEYNFVKGRTAQIKEENPVATTLGGITGAVASTIPLVAAAPAAFGLGAGPMSMRMLASGGTNAAIGGADAAVRSGGGMQQAALGAGVGAGLGLIAPPVAAGVGKAVGAVANRVRPPAAIPSADEIKTAARAAYQAADDAGVRIGQPSFKQGVDDIAQAVKEAGIDRTIHPKATAALSRFQEASGSSPTLKEVDILRRVASAAAGSIEPDEKRIGSMLIGQLDDYVGRLKPADVVGGDVDTGVKALTEARGLWSKLAKSEQISEAIMKAERRAASTGSGGNVENAIRQNIRRILDSPRESRGFTASEKALMEQIVRGTPAQNAMRLAGKLSPSGNGLMAALGIGATAANPLAAIPITGGILAKSFADKTVTRNADKLDKMVRAGGLLGPSPASLAARKEAEKLTRGLLAPTLPYANRRLTGQ